MLLLTVRCSAGQGFGDARRGQPPSVKPGKRKHGTGVESADGKAVQRAVRLVEEQEGRRRQPSAARPIDPREAARGKVEYVKVKDWGSGQLQDLGSLQVAAEPQVFEAGGSGGSDGPAQPFHEALARRLELLQTQGALGMAQLPGGKPLPEFQRWAFAREHYIQYLADRHAVHVALESSIATAAAEVSAAAAGAAEQDDNEENLQLGRLQQALELFGTQQGLDRAGALLHDLQCLNAHDQQQLHEGGSSRSSSTSSAAPGGDFWPPAATQHAGAYAAYIASLARRCRAAEGEEELEQAVLRLLAHAYMLHLMQLTSSGRIAAAAAEKLDLAGTNALASHQSYPALDARLGPGAKPLEAFVADTNRLGEVLSWEQREILMEELAKAMTKSSMLLVPLAREV